MSLVVRVFAPIGRDAELMTEVLTKGGVAAQIATFETLGLSGLDIGSLGPLLIAEEALTSNVIEELSSFLRRQPAWSDLPILILTGSGRETWRNHRSQNDRLALGSAVLLERPIRSETLVSSVRAALQARIKQYEVRDVVAELDHQRETLEAMLDNLPVGVVLAKASGEIVRGNKKLEEILRHPLLKSKDIEEHGDWVAFHRDGRRVEGAEFPLPRAMKAKQALPAEEYLYQRGDGTTAWISLAAAPIVNTEGDVTGGVVSIIDIDQQKRSEAALIQNEKLAAVGRLASSISHEINNPLEAVTNLLYLARQDATLSPETKTMLETADQELSRVSQIASHTLQFHRQATKPRAVSLQELLKPTLGLYAGRLQNSGVVMDFQDRSKAVVTCFEGEIRQVLNNLVGNAVDAMKTGGKLTIRASDSHSRRDGVPGVRISVADSGHGIKPEVIQHIFEAFYTTKGINGTGLGLWISKGIVQKHSGDLKVRSCRTPGRSGTTFMIFLPASPF